VDDAWKRERNERAVRDHFRKITNQAEARMRERTARQQLIAAQAELNREQDYSVADGDDSSLQNIMR
jgi:hypothetical protein